MMKPKLHYYNPGHETVVLLNSSNYTPPVNVQKMLRDLAFLPAWYADDGDFVFVEEKLSPRFFSILPKEIRPKITLLSREDIRKKAHTLPKIAASPWGLSLQSIKLFTQLRNEYKLDIEIPVWKDEYIKLTSRQTAALCYKRIKELLPEIPLPPVPQFFFNLDDLESWLENQAGSYIIKTPYSSSGRGLLWLDTNKLTDKGRNWIKSALKKQNCISIEPALNRKNDFALEFYSDGKGSIIYKGISLFGTNKRGAYEGNRMESQQRLHSLLEGELTNDVFQKIKDTVTVALQETYSSYYNGYIGVDMLTYNNDNHSISIHPCIEINMRNTMGMIAIRIFEQFVHEQSSGIFKVVYKSNPRHAYMEHQFDKAAYPVTIMDGKLKSGYIPLCPVTPKTNYRAFIIIIE